MAPHFTPHPWTLAGRYEGADVFVSPRAGEVPNGYRSGVAVHLAGDWRIDERAQILDLPRKAAENDYANHVTKTVSNPAALLARDGRHTDPDGAHAETIRELTALLPQT